MIPLLTPAEVIRAESRVRDDIMEWIRENIPNREWGIDTDGKPTLILDEEDAIMYRLRFGYRLGE